MSGIIPDPDWDDFDGLYVCGMDEPEEIEYDMRALMKYMTKKGTNTYKDLTEEELEQFRIKKN